MKGEKGKPGTVKVGELPHTLERKPEAKGLEPFQVAGAPDLTSIPPSYLLAPDDDLQIGRAGGMALG